MYPTPDSRPVNAAAESRAVHKVARRILPFLFILYLSAFIDRVNLGFAAVNFRQDLGLSNGAYGLGAGMFFIGYFLFEVPSNLIMERTGARTWIARIMITWAIVSGSMMFVHTRNEFFLCRFLLGVAEAGFFPGMILYLTYWFPAEHRARAVSQFMLASPLASVVGSPVSLWIMKYMPGIAHRSFSVTSTFAALKGWQWLFMLEAIPSFIMTFAVLIFLTDKPGQARWLDSDERDALIAVLDKERAETESKHRSSLLQAFIHPRVLLLTSIYLTMNICNYGLDFWLPIILKSFKSIDTSKPNIYSMLPYISAAIGMVIIGSHSDKTRERSLHIFVPCLLSSIAMLGFAWYQGRSAFGGLVCITLATIGPRAILGPFWTLPPMFLTGTAMAGAIAAINSVGNLGGIVGPTLFGKMKDATGSDVPGIIMLAGAILVTGLLGLCVRKDVRRSALNNPLEYPST